MIVLDRRLGLLAQLDPGREAPPAPRAGSRSRRRAGRAIWTMLIAARTLAPRLIRRWWRVARVIATAGCEPASSSSILRCCGDDPDLLVEGLVVEPDDLEAVAEGLAEVRCRDELLRVLRRDDGEARRRRGSARASGSSTSPSSSAGSSTFCTDSGMRLSSLMKRTPAPVIAWTIGPGTNDACE